MIEKLSGTIASMIALSLDLDDDNKDVLAYGAYSIIQTLWSISLVIILGLIFGVLFEAFIISFAGALLRKYSGGVHASSPNKCAILGAVMSVGQAKFSIILGFNSIEKLNFLLCLTSYIVTYYCIYKYSPIDSANKPIVKIETRTRLKNASLKVVHFFLILTTVSYLLFYKNYNYQLLSLISSVSVGQLSQSLSLTPLGHLAINTLSRTMEEIGVK